MFRSSIVCGLSIEQNFYGHQSIMKRKGDMTSAWERSEMCIENVSPKIGIGIGCRWQNKVKNTF